MTLGIEREGLEEPLRDAGRAGTPVLGTCAGMIMLDRAHLGVLDVLASATRSAGSCARSRPTSRSLAYAGGPVHAVFIRAPWVPSTAPGRVLAAVEGHPVAVRQGNVLAVAFHPELTGETRLHELLLALNGG